MPLVKWLLLVLALLYVVPLSLGEEYYSIPLPVGGFDTELNASPDMADILRLSDNVRWEIPAGKSISVVFSSPLVPEQATITSVRVHVEHHESPGFGQGNLEWNIGTDFPSSSEVWATARPLVHSGYCDERHDISSPGALLNDVPKVNDLEFQVRNLDPNSSTYIDMVYFEVSWTTEPMWTAESVDLGPDLELYADPSGLANLSLNATPGEGVHHEWMSNSSTVGTGPQLNLSLTPGNHTIILVLSTEDGISAMDSLRVRVLPFKETPVVTETTNATLDTLSWVNISAMAVTEPSNATLDNLSWVNTSAPVG